MKKIWILVLSFLLILVGCEAPKAGSTESDYNMKTVSEFRKLQRVQSGRYELQMKSAKVEDKVAHFEFYLMNQTVDKIEYQNQIQAKVSQNGKEAPAAIQYAIPAPSDMESLPKETPTEILGPYGLLEMYVTARIDSELFTELIITLDDQTVVYKLEMDADNTEQVLQLGEEAIRKSIPVEANLFILQNGYLKDGTAYIELNRNGWLGEKTINDRYEFTLIHQKNEITSNDLVEVQYLDPMFAMTPFWGIDGLVEEQYRDPGEITVGAYTLSFQIGEIENGTDVLIRIRSLQNENLQAEVPFQIVHEINNPLCAICDKEMNLFPVE